MEVGLLVLKGGRAQGEETFDVPPPDVVLGGIDEDREVEEVGQEDPGDAAVGSGAGL